MTNNCSVDQLKQRLQQHYDLICFEDLADYYDQHGSIFDLFKKYYSPEFRPNQRICLYSGTTLSQDFLDHIQRAAQQVDISNYFIVIVSPTDIRENLQQSNKKFGNDAQSIGSEILNLADTKPMPLPGFFSNIDTICPYLWTAVEVGSSYDSVRPCCKFKGSLGNVQESEINDIFTGKVASDIRQQLTKGVKIPQCQVCWDAESYGTKSLRQYAWGKLGNKFEQHYFDKPTVKYITVSPSSLCNFSCRICNYKASSKIAAEEFAHAIDPDQKNIFKFYMKNHTNSTLNGKVLEAIDNVELIHILGGEPFVWSDFLDFLNQLVQFGHADHLRLELHSNASTYPTEVVDLLKQFDSVEILLSIDDVGPRFELQRGGEWQSILKNIKKFSELQSESIKIKFATTVNIQNVLYLDELINLSNSLGIEIVWAYLEDPDFLCIDNMTKTAKKLVYQKFQNYNHPELIAIAQRVVSTKPVTGDKFLQYMSELDARRGQNFAQTHKEIFDAMQG